jgi:hypothetical protein
MAPAIPPSRWLAPEAIVAQTPSRIDRPIALPWCLAAAIVAAPNLIIAQVAWSYSEPLAFVAVATMVFTYIRWHSPVYRFIQNARLSLPLEELRRSGTLLSGRTTSTVGISGVHPGRWICVRSEHEQARRHLRGGNARVPYEPEMQFRYCIARYRDSKVSCKVAFSDGDEITYYPTKDAFFLDYDPPKSSLLKFDPAGASEAAKKLTYVLDVIALYDAVPLKDLYTHGATDDTAEAFWRALRAGCVWGLIRSADPNREVELYTILAKEDALASDRLVVCLTGAGAVWIQCNPEFLDLAERRAKVEQEAQRSIKIGKIDVSGGTNTGWNFGHVAGDMNNTNATVSKEDVLKALAEIVQTPGVPWQSDDDRAAATRAVVQRDVDSKRLKPIIARLLAAVEKIGFSLAETGALEVLKSFIVS